MTDIKRALHEAHLRYQRSKLKADTVGIPSTEVRGVRYREPASRTWQGQHRDYRPVGYYKVFCAHDRLYIEPCKQCRRNTREAQRNTRRWQHEQAVAQAQAAHTKS